MAFMDESAANGEREGPISEINRHIAQAIILMQESRLGYKFHRWFASGHLAIAESMMLTDDPSRDVETLRSCRLDIMSGNTTDLRDWLAPRYHRTMAVAHLMEAESESRREHPELASAIRKGRIDIETGHDEPNFDYLCRLVCLYDGGPQAADLEQPAGNSKQFDEVTR
jgi:hypothetical protein